MTAVNILLYLILCWCETKLLHLSIILYCYNQYETNCPLGWCCYKIDLTFACLCMSGTVWACVDVEGKNICVCFWVLCPKTNCHLRFDTFQLNARGGGETSGATWIHPTASRIAERWTPDTRRVLSNIIFSLLIPNSSCFIFYFYLEVAVC